ncbi:MAG: two-component regulator propeller domain-containing protein [bacterium]|nr:two-component regulator propeller domain-containing protein [bacterium]
MRKNNLLFFTVFVFSVIAGNCFAQYAGWTNYTNAKYAQAIADSGNELWIGTYTSGIIKMNKTTGEMTFYNHANSGLPDNEVWALVIEGTTGDIWIGTYSGLAKFDGTNWTVFNTSNSGLPHNEVRALAIEGNNIWIGTYGGGLAKFDGTNWTVFNSSNYGLPSNGVSAL